MKNIRPDKLLFSHPYIKKKVSFTFRWSLLCVSLCLLSCHQTSLKWVWLCFLCSLPSDINIQWWNPPWISVLQAQQSQPPQSLLIWGMLQSPNHLTGSSLPSIDKVTSFRAREAGTSHYTSGSVVGRNLCGLSTEIDSTSPPWWSWQSQTLRSCGSHSLPSGDRDAGSVRHRGLQCQSAWWSEAWQSLHRWGLRG